jgi:hypothetical protein
VASGLPGEVCNVHRSSALPLISLDDDRNDPLAKQRMVIDHEKFNRLRFAAHAFRSSSSGAS